MFESPVHQETFEKLKEYLGELFDEPYHDPENDHFYVRYGTTVLEISVEPYGSEETVIVIMSYCVQDVELDEELKYSRWSIPVSCCSITWVTDFSAVSALAPG